jgi:hypothetical protein
MRTTEQKKATLKAWLKRRASHHLPVTADELIARIKRNWPETNSTDIDYLYQELGHI